jgi:hypothetical protein
MYVVFMLSARNIIIELLSDSFFRTWLGSIGLMSPRLKTLKQGKCMLVYLGAMFACHNVKFARGKK